MLNNKKVKLIYISDMEGLIGVCQKDNWEQPFFFKKDLQKFKELTEHNIVIMGRETFDSMNKVPLPNRKIIVLTKNTDYKNTIDSSISVVHSIAEAFQEADKLGKHNGDIFIAGGKFVYEQFLPYTDEIFHTKILNKFSDDFYGKFKYFNPDFTNFKLKKYSIVTDINKLTNKSETLIFSRYTK